MLTPEIFRSHFARALPYDAYVATAKPHESDKWRSSHASLRLTAAQSALLGSFTRDILILATSGTWCGDCAVQVPMLDHIQRASNGKVRLRLAPRDDHMELVEQLMICGGHRVPTVYFLNEDFDPLVVYGDKSLARLRGAAKRQLGASCEVPGAPQPADELAATLQDWVDQTERAHLIARLSTKLRERYQD
jgi:hypothetical protein